MNLILAFFACEFNIYGLLFYMSDTRKITDILKKMNRKARIFSALTILGVAVGAMQLEICLFAFLALEYVGVLLNCRKEKKECLQPALRGVVAIIISILVELSIIFLYYYWGIENLEYTGKINAEIKLASYIAMALAQCILIMFREMCKMTAGYRLALMATLAAKTVADLIWL